MKNAKCLTKGRKVTNAYTQIIITALAVLAPACLSAQQLPIPTTTAEVPGPAGGPSGWLERDTLTGDWGGNRTWLQERGISFKPRLTQFYQGLASGDGDHGFEYGGKADLLLNLDAAKLGTWDGLSLTVHAEYNFGESANGRGGTLLPVNTALLFPGLDGADAFDLSSFFLAQKFSDSVSLMLGKINMVDIAAGKPFMGGAGIDAFQHIAFAAPPSGVVPPYIFGGILSVRTKPASLTLMIYDPVSAVNRSGLEHPFNEGVTFRVSVDVPVTIAGRSGHQGLAAAYSTQDGTDLSSLGDIILPPPGGGIVDIKNDRYHFAYLFDQFLYQSKENPTEGFGLFGQVAISDGNPNPLDWSVLAGVGGTGLIPGRSRDKWGVGFFYYSVSSALKRSLSPAVAIDDERGVEMFYNAALTPWFNLTADVQIIDPALNQNDTAVFAGLRAVIKF